MRVVIIGDGPEKERLHRLAADLGMREAVAFLGPVPHTEIGQHIRALDALVVPSRRLGDWVEQFGRILLEGMALKVPVIGSTCGEIPNILRECGGLIHDENDSESLSSQMSAVMTMSASDRRLLTMHAAENARARYDYAAVAARYRDLIIAETGRHAATPRACREIPR